MTDEQISDLADRIADETAAPCQWGEAYDTALAAIKATLQLAAPTEVWMVTSRTISAVFTSEERAQQFANGLPPTVSGGLSVYRCPVHA